MVSADLVTAIAASVAAVLSGLTLAVTSLQSERNYRRQALDDAMMQMMKASFSGILPSTYRARAAGEDMTPYKAKALNAHDVENDARTRLRLVASKTVVARADDLHGVEDRLWTAVFGDGPLMKLDDWRELTAKRREAQNALYEAARRNMGLGGFAFRQASSEAYGPHDRDRREVEAFLRELPEITSGS